MRPHDTTESDAAILARGLGVALQTLRDMAPDLVRIGVRLIGLARARQILDELEKEETP